MIPAVLFHWFKNSSNLLYYWKKNTGETTTLYLLEELITPELRCTANISVSPIIIIVQSRRNYVQK